MNGNLNFITLKYTCTSVLILLLTNHPHYGNSKLRQRKRNKFIL